MTDETRRATFWVDDNGQMRRAEIPADVSPNGIDIGARCQHPLCSARIIAMDYEQRSASCELGHKRTLPERFIQADNEHAVLRIRGSRIAPTYYGHPVEPSP